MPESDGKYSKVEREILEILDDMEDKAPSRRPPNVVDFKRPRRRVPRIRMPDLSELRYALTPAKLMLTMLVAILGAVFLQSVPFLSPILVVVAIAAFAGVFFAKSRPTTPRSIGKNPSTKRWRGRDIDLSRRR